MVETNREGKLTAIAPSWGTGKMYFAPEALELGLIDKIDSFFQHPKLFLYKMKVLTDKQHAELLAGSSAFTQIVNAIVESGEDITARRISPLKLSFRWYRQMTLPR